ncbi:MAG TPA: metallophosphoesterase family protein [Chthoniobacterales bacterium]|nr:metallophosphoesterase family protein [Chthoniobacterales bacterium]
MRVAAIYDIHGNLPALEAVLAEIRQVNADEIVVGGDVVPGPMPRETLDRLLDLDLPARFLQGNGDRVVLGAMRGEEPGEVPEPFREQIRWNARQLTAAHQKVLATWPKTIRMKVEGLGDVLFCHATPRNDTDVFTRLTPEKRLLPLFQNLDVDFVVCGHTHMQFERIIGGVRVINAGSVGMPFGEPGGYWVLLGPEIQLRNTSYDLAKAAERIRTTSYPQACSFADRNVFGPPSEAEMLGAFGRVELK